MFLMGNSYEAGTEEETRQGIIAADAAKAAGIGHLIYSSVGDANKKTGIPHFESKYLVEKHVAGLGISYTISAPVAFMDNTVAPWSIDGAAPGGPCRSRLSPERVLQTGGPGGYWRIRRRLGRAACRASSASVSTFAGDELSGEAQAKILSQAIGRPITYQEIPDCCDYASKVRIRR